MPDGGDARLDSGLRTRGGRAGDAPPLDVRLLLLVVLLSVSACGSPTEAGDDPPGSDRVVNDRVENANGIHVPESCSAPGSSIVPLGSLDLPERLFDVWAYYDPATEREYALAGFQSSETSGGGLYVIDVTDPTNPTLAATLEAAEAQDVVVWMNYAYTVTGSAGAGDFGVVYDLTDPREPVAVGTFPSGHNLFVSDRGYLSINDELASERNRNLDITVWDVAAEEIVGTFKDTLSTMHDNWELCDRLVVAFYTRDWCRSTSAIPSTRASRTPATRTRRPRAPGCSGARSARSRTHGPETSS